MPLSSHFIFESMGKKPPKISRPSFFKVLIKDFSSRLRLPHVFVDKHGKYLRENAKLRTISGETWDVKLEEEINDDDDEKYRCFVGGGWSKFVKGLELKLGEFLVFWFNIGDCTFDVSIYGTHCCEREISAMVVDSDGNEDFAIQSEEVINKRRSRARNNGATSKLNQCMEKSSPFYIEIVLKPHHKSKMSFSRRMWMEAGLKGTKTARLKYVRKNSYQNSYQSVVVYDRAKHSRIDLGRGWYDFRSKNGLVYENMYSFHFKPSKNIIYVKEVKKET